MHDNIRKNTSGRAVASTRQTEALASVIVYIFFLPLNKGESKKPAKYLYEENLTRDITSVIIEGFRTKKAYRFLGQFSFFSGSS